MRHWGFLLALAALPLAAQDRRVEPVAQGPRRVALAIGNNAYRDHPLQNAVNDAQAVRAALADVGFEVDLKLNLGMAQLEQAASEFAARVRPGDVAVFYYSGHGIQVGGENYLIPVDFDARTAVDAKYKSYAASRVQENLEAAGVALQIIILDACRDNPYRGLRSGSGGLAAMQAGKGTYIAFATGPGRTADDNASGRNGLFTGALVEALRQPGLTLDQVFNRVRVRVAAVRPEQVPWSSSNVLGEFYFRPGAPVVATGATAAAPDLEAWETVRAASDPRLFEQFLREYPASQYAGAARLKLAALRPAVAAPSPPPAIRPPDPAAGTTKVNPKDGLAYVWVPPGSFMMGCSPGDKQCFANEMPARPVEIARGFWLGESLVTQAAWKRVTGNDPSKQKGADLPVESVTWPESQSYCHAVGGRLPTEAEWEYAARAGSTAARYGDLDRIAWYAGNGGSGSHPVKQKQPNAWELYDMLGNVSEWTADLSADGRTRVLRGGASVGSADYVRVSDRDGLPPDGRNTTVGLRCLLEGN
jgi:formylglycine-generating enzyme required for sulfatase activity